MPNDNSIESWRERIAKAAEVEGFEASEIGHLFIGWINQEILRLTNQLVNDELLDTDNVKRAAVRAELNAYRTIAGKLGLTKTLGQMAKNTLKQNGIDEEEETDTRSPEEIAGATS